MSKQKCWVIGKLVTLPNDYEYIAEPYIAFNTEGYALSALKMIEDVSGERVGIREAAFHHRALEAQGSGE